MADVSSLEHDSSDDEVQVKIPIEDLRNRRSKMKVDNRAIKSRKVISKTSRPRGKPWCREDNDEIWETL